MTNGTKVEISRTGTQVIFRPGMITGGVVNLDCGTERCISYFLEPLLLLSPFCKVPMVIKLKGVTNAPGEISVDGMKASWLKVYNKFVLNDEKLDIKIQARGLKPEGGGVVVFTAPIVKTLRPVKVSLLYSFLPKQNVNLRDNKSEKFVKFEVKHMLLKLHLH